MRRRRRELRRRRLWCAAKGRSSWGLYRAGRAPRGDGQGHEMTVTKVTIWRSCSGARAPFGRGSVIVAVEPAMIAVLICDDHPLFRQGLRRLLETVEEFAVVGEVERAEEVTAAVRKGRPDVVVLDVE